MSHRIKFITIIGIFTLNCVFNAHANTANDIYRMAQQSPSMLNKISDINTMDNSGNTALCNAILNDDVDAYNILKKAGANTEHKCVKKIPTEQYKSFTQKLATANKSWSFLGMGKWAWGAIGLGVAGGAVAAGMGGGGSSGGTQGDQYVPDPESLLSCQERGFTYSQSDTCPEGWEKDFAVCLDGEVFWYKCNTPHTCPSSYFTECTGAWQDMPGANTCLSGTTIYKECQPVSCDGYVTYCDVGYTAIIGDTCQSGYDTLVKCQPNECAGYEVSCGIGYTEVYGDTCPSGETTLVKCAPNTCDEYVNSCGFGYTEVIGDTCQSGNDTLVKCEFDDENYIVQNDVIYQKLNCVNGDQVANTCSCNDGWVGDLCDSPAVCGENYRTECTGGWETTSNTCQSGDTLYYECQQVQCSTNQIWSESGCVNCGNNAYADGNQCQCNPGYAAWVAETGCIEISNCGSHAYKQGLNCICEPGYENWEYGIGCVPQADAVTIDNIADDDVTGKLGSNKNGIINIHNTNDNNTVYGVRGSGYSDNSNGIIYIENTGNSDVYGAFGGSSCYSSANFLETNYYLPDGQDLVVSSNIQIINRGDGDVYGAYRQLLLHGNELPYAFNANLAIDSSRTPYAYVNAIANIDLNNAVGGNYGNGDVYGLWGAYLFNAYANRSDFYTDASSIALGKIQITNGNGNAYGMYVPYDSTVLVNAGINAHHADGEITIFNIGTGNAYGMYGPNITNLDISESTDRSGIINLINYDAGNIFGMYGSNISNENASSGDGESIINLQNLGSGQAVGICLRKYFGLNSGTININNVGTGTAIGASGGMTNNGIINITRESYTDEGGWIYMPEASNYIQDPYDPENYILETIPAHMEYASDYIYNPTGTSGSVFGMYNGIGSIYNTGTLNISSNGDAYGMYSEDAYNITNSGNINITSYGNIYGIYTKHTDFTINNSSNMILNNLGNGNVYGVYSAANNLGESHYGNINGILNITNNGAGDAYGMYIEGVPISRFASNNLGNISILNEGTGKAYGMYGRYISNNNGGAISIVNDSNNTVYGMLGYSVTNNGSVNIQNLSNGDAIGLFSSLNVFNYGSESFARNAGGITINNIGEGTAIGILGDTNTNITNSGGIVITREAYVDENDVTHNPTTNSGTIYGIYAKSGSTVNNSGAIVMTSNSLSNMYGIYAEAGATVTNTGWISFNNDAEYCQGTSSPLCDGSVTRSTLIVLNGANLINSGIMQMQSLNLNATGGNVVAGLGSQFVVDNELSGDLNISSELVQNGNQTTYIAENMIDAGDVSGLNVRSASAMFNASLADNGHDVVMQMKDFNELTDNASLAAFLKNNYTNGNGTELFSTLKSIDNMSAFNNTLSGLTGLNTFTQFAHEDLSAMREISFSMNNKLFENSGRDSFDISDSTGYFSFSNDHNGGSGRYGISSDKISDNWKLGYGMAMANINTGDGDNMHRQNNVWLFYMPATYTNNDIELVIAPKAGFAHSEYNRRGYNNINYEGYIEKRIFGLMNDLRYPLTFGNWTFAPDLAFNAIVYDQSGHEDEQAFSLVIPDDRTVSVETGLGFYTKYEKQLSDGSRFKLNSGLMVYREFGDTYDIKLGMRGMDGTFSLYNNDYEYRGAATLGFDYKSGRFSLYGNAQYFVDSDAYTNVKAGFRLHF